MPRAPATLTTAAATPGGSTGCSATTATTNDYSWQPAAVVKRAALHRAVDAGSPSTRTTTGRVRGLLRDDCNQIVGLFHDDPALVRSAAQYAGSGGQHR